MRYALILSTALFCAASAAAETSIAVRAGSGDFEFGFLYSDRDRLEAKEHGDDISEADFLVALRLGEKSQVELGVILDWRRDGASWQVVTERCKLEDDVYYVELPDDAGPPYGRAWGHWKKRDGAKLALNDDEIRALVELRALADFSGQSPSEVLRQKKQGASASAIAGKGKGKSSGKGPAASPAGSKGKSKH